MFAVVKVHVVVWTLSSVFSLIFFMRIGGACRSRVLCYLQKSYFSPKEAEKVLLIPGVSSPRVEVPSNPMDEEMQELDSGDTRSSVAACHTQISKSDCMEWFQYLSSKEQSDFLTSLYVHHASIHYFGLSFLPAFLELSLKAKERKEYHHV